MRLRVGGGQDSVVFPGRAPLEIRGQQLESSSPAPGLLQTSFLLTFGWSRYCLNMKVCARMCLCWDLFFWRACDRMPMRLWESPGFFLGWGIH